MKKTILTLPLLAVILSTLLTFVSCSKKAELTPVTFKTLEVKKDNITVCVDPRTEVLLIASRLAEISFFANHDMDGDDYITGIDKIMEKQKKLNIFTYI